jgi:hypothetical protein
MGILSPHYNLTFDGVSAWEQSSSGYLPGRMIGTEGTLYSLRDGVHVFSDMGRADPPWEITVAVEGTQRAALQGKRGVEGTLVWSRGTQTATLLDIIDSPGKAGAFDAYTIVLRLFSADTPSGVTASSGLTSEAGDLFITEAGEYLAQE